MENEKQKIDISYHHFLKKLKMKNSGVYFEKHKYEEKLRKGKFENNHNFSYLKKKLAKNMAKTIKKKSYNRSTN